MIDYYNRQQERRQRLRRFADRRLPRITLGDFAYWTLVYSLAAWGFADIAVTIGEAF